MWHFTLSHRAYQVTNRVELGRFICDSSKICFQFWPKLRSFDCLLWHFHLDIKMHLKFHTDKAELLILHAKTCFSHGPPISTKVNSSFRFLGQKLFSILDFSLSLIALIQAMNKTCWLCLQNVSRTWPLLITSTAMIRFTIISCLNLMIRPNFLYSQRSEADIEGTAWHFLRTDKCSTWPESCCHCCNVYSFPSL